MEDRLIEQLKCGKSCLAVVGLGYVGMPIAVAFAKKNIRVIEYDINEKKIEQYEPGIDPTNEVGNEEIKNSNVCFTSDEKKLKEAMRISKLNKSELTEKMTEELQALRAKIGLSQGELSKMVGISRQTYCAVETKKHPMFWSTYMALLLVFDNNEKTKGMLDIIGVFLQELRDIFNFSYR
jgi:DNA-binding XRE family transcriptional regulator